MHTYVRKLKFNAGRFDPEVFVNCKMRKKCLCCSEFGGTYTEMVLGCEMLKTLHVLVLVCVCVCVSADLLH